MSERTMIDAAASGSFALGKNLSVHRLGFGAMQITGRGIWGEPRDRPEALRVLREAIELGVNFIDTADSYGPHVSEELICEALYPYPEGLVIATKAGFLRTGPEKWHVCCRPDYLRQQVELSLRRLKLERIDLWQLHRVDPDVPCEEQFGLMADLIQEGKIRYAGLSEVSIEQIEAARRQVPIASVQNLYNLSNRQSEQVLEYCEREGIGFIPWYPLDTGRLARPGGPLQTIASRHGAMPAQVALAWLLRRSPVMLPIPGTSSTEHLRENVASASLSLDEDELAQLSALNVDG